MGMEARWRLVRGELSVEYFPLKYSEHVANRHKHVVEGRGYLLSSTESVGEPYLILDVPLHFHIRFLWVNEPFELCAVFYSASRSRRHWRVLRPGGASDAEIRRLEERRRGGQEFVFVRNVKLLKEKQEVGAIRMLVRLQSLNDPGSTGLNPAEAAGAKPPVDPLVIKDREHGQPVGLGPVGGVPLGELPSEMVQGGTSVVDHVADDERPQIQWRFPDYAVAKDVVETLHLSIDGKWTRLLCVESRRIRFKEFEVVRGPSELEFRAFKRVAHANSSSREVVDAEG